jgi:hypothetical protein
METQNKQKWKLIDNYTIKYFKTQKLAIRYAEMSFGFCIERIEEEELKGGNKE